MDFRERFLDLLQSENQHDLQQPLYQELNHRGFSLGVLRSPEVLEKFVWLLGPDLAYMKNPELAVNVKQVTGDY